MICFIYLSLTIKLLVCAMSCSLQNLSLVCDSIIDSINPQGLSAIDAVTLKIDWSQYVYKSCSNYLVILQKLEDTITNEDRKSVVNPFYAKFRADKLRTIHIINMLDLNDRPNEIMHTNINIKKSLKYEVGMIVYPDSFDMNIDSVCTSGIHYFASLEPVFYFSDTVRSKYTGLWKRWYDNGTMMMRFDCVDGKVDGLYEEWLAENNDQISMKINYTNGQLDGLYEGWYKNGQISRRHNYVHGKLHGQHESWYSNGQMSRRCIMVDGRIDGLYEEWYENGQRMEQSRYVYGVQVAKDHIKITRPDMFV